MNFEIGGYEMNLSLQYKKRDFVLLVLVCLIFYLAPGEVRTSNLLPPDLLSNSKDLQLESPYQNANFYSSRVASSATFIITYVPQIDITLE